MPASTDHAAPSPLSNTEALLWMIERDPALRSTIMGIAVLDGPVDVDRLRRRVEQAAQAFPRLRQRVTRTRRGGLLWTEASEWDPDQHLTHFRLPRPGTMRQLLDVAGEQAGEAFDPARPLWHLTLFDGLDDDRSALVVKMHHAMTDGIGGVGLMWLFADHEPHPQSPPALAARSSSSSTSSSSSPSTSTPKRQRPSALSTALSILGSAMTDPLEALRATPKAARSTAKILAPATHALSPLMTGRGLDRHLDVIDVPLRALQRAGHAADGTVNDAFMAAVVGGLRRYHIAHGQTPSELRVTMPISIRGETDDPGGNRFTPARFTVPLEIDDPVRRIETLGSIARQWKHEPAVGLTDVLADALNRLPEAVTTSLFGSMLKGVDFVASNIPGSRERCWLAGAEVLRFYGFAPPSGSAVSVTLVSHVGTCCIGINADRAAIADPDLLRTSLAEGIDEVLALGRSRQARRRTAASPAVHGHPAPHRLSALDASFLEAETEKTPMHVGALMVLDGDPLRDARGELRIDDIRAAIAEQLPRSPRMRQVVVPVPLARPVWEDDPTFDIAEHVHHVRVSPPGTRAELERLCCELQMQLLDRTKPLWEMWFVDGLVDGRVGLVYKVHHAVVDGVSAAETFEVLLGAEAPNASWPCERPAGSPLERVMSGLVDEVRTSARLWMGAGARLVSNPATAVATALALVQLAGPSLLAPHTTLNRPVGDGRRLVPVRFDLTELKSVGRRYDATVNDVLLTLVGAGLGALLASRGDAVEQVQVLVPVSLRGDTEHNGVGNRVTALIMPLPIEQDAVSALRSIAAETRSRKRSPEAAALDLLFRTFDAWPAGVVGPASRQIVQHQPFVNVVVTNVRGAERPLCLLGSQIAEIVPVVPLGPNLSLGVAALSYAGNLVVGLHADAEACADVDLVADGMKAAFAHLMNAPETTPVLAANPARARPSPRQRSHAR